MSLVPINTNKFHLALKEGDRGNRYKGKPKVVAAMERGDAQFVIDSLTEKQRLFVEEYMKDLDPGPAVKRAGFLCKPGNEGAMGRQFLKHPGIRYSIDALKARRAKESDVTSDFVLRKVLSVIKRCEEAEARGEKVDNPSILRATELLMRHLGMLRDRTEISGPDGGPIETKETQDAANEFLTAIGRLSKRAEVSSPDLSVVAGTGETG